MARDLYGRYYTEKLWEWIPELYRHEDGLASNPNVLRSLIEIVGAHAAVARRDVDRVWEDQFADFADDWAIPYIGDLVGTRLLNALNRRGRRADVAQTIFYRRRKGTTTVLETLIRDITGWDGVVVESFRRLARTAHRLDAPVTGPGAAPSGRVTGTPPGGLADLRHARGGDLVDGPFEEYSRTVDVRQLRGHLGRFNIPKLNIHLYRQLAFGIDFPTPLPLDAVNFTFDPSGREVVLFRPSHEDDDECTLTEEWRITAPLTCRLLGEARFVIKPEDVPGTLTTAQQTAVGRFIGIAFYESRLRTVLAGALPTAVFDATIYTILSNAITVDSPKRNLYPDAVSVSAGARFDTAPVFARERTIAAALPPVVPPAGPPPAVPRPFQKGQELAIDPVRGRFRLAADPGAAKVFVPRCSVGLFGPLGAGTYSRREDLITAGVIDLPDGGPTNPGPVGGFALPATGDFQFTTSKTYRPNSPPGAVLDHVRQLTLQAVDGARPYVRLVPSAGGATWTFKAEPKPANFDASDPVNQRYLVIDGLWLGVVPSGLAEEDVADEDTPPTPVPTTITIDGVFDRVVLRHCTLDPGGERARLKPTRALAIPFVQLDIVGEVEELVIEQSITGPIHELSNRSDPGSAGRIVIRDSVVDARFSETAIETRLATLVLERSTVFGNINANRLEATEALIDGVVKITDRQHGCFRFSATNQRGARLPQQFESHLFDPRMSRQVFVSRRFGDAGYAQLSPVAPAALMRGAENRSEIGVWNRLLGPIKRDDLAAKVTEYMPFGLIAQLIDET